MNRKLIFDQKGLEAFAKNLKTLRNKYNFTQEELAYKSGLTLSQIARIETVKINPTLSTIFTLARAMEIPLKEFFDFDL